MSWYTQALCAQPEFRKLRDVWFPRPGERAKLEFAKQVCAACPVRQACLDDALRQEGGCGHESRHGVRGGLAPRARRYLYDRQRKAQQQAAA
ncbi:WhiB family transcriptional regulator [Streptomyces sp.]|uniref:WhiB family transcriptional regulator n=1 Tax=Streptomyces sp. TaxID=1931 RepID=UPI002D5345A9|nr:WhiB family transcriptional regulator [Streptomyces sp.]HZF92031.1 WhiB family transcriptional regulator [Streptomyces sp.]